MCTKWFNDGDIHATLVRTITPYEAYMNFMNAYHDLCGRLSEKAFGIMSAKGGIMGRTVV